MNVYYQHRVIEVTSPPRNSLPNTISEAREYRGGKSWDLSLGLTRKERGTAFFALSGRTAINSFYDDMGVTNSSQLKHMSVLAIEDDSPERDPSATILGLCV